MTTIINNFFAISNYSNAILKLNHQQDDIFFFTLFISIRQFFFDKAFKNIAPKQIFAIELYSTIFPQNGTRTLVRRPFDRQPLVRQTLGRRPFDRLIA